MHSARPTRSLSAPRALGLAFGLALAAVAPLPARGAEEGKSAVENVQFKGWNNNLRLSNGDAELIITLDVGPRVISYKLNDGDNVFKLYEEQLGKSGESSWMIRGGHRLWSSPELTDRTYYPDNAPVKHEATGTRSVRLTPPPESKWGLQKELEVTLADSGSAVTLVHRIKNVGDKPTELAVWALSVMAPGGTEIIPIPPHKPHPGGDPDAKSEDFAPAYNLILWPYADFTDKRFQTGSKYLMLHQDATAKGPIKIGLGHGAGWVGYLNRGTLFVKRFEYKRGATYPDLGSNFETFTNPDMLEIETLGPLRMLKPGEVAEHTERWELIGGLGEVKTEADIDAKVRPKVRD